MGSQGTKPDQPRSNGALTVGLAVTLVIAGAMLLAGTVQLRQMRSDFTDMDKMVSLLKRQSSALQEEKGSLEAKLAEKEKDVEASIDMLGEKKLRVRELEKALKDKDAEVQERDRALEARQAQVETNKNAAKKLALVLAQTQADKERLKNDMAALIRPEIDKCNEAMAAKDAAISALVSEREKAESDIAKSELEAAKAKKKMMEIQKELDLKAVEVEQLKAWKAEANKELKQQTERSKSIWAASVKRREAGQAEPPPSHLATTIALPPSAVFGPEGLGAHLHSISRATGLELGLAGDSNFTSALLSAWRFAKSYAIVDLGSENGETIEQAKSRMAALDSRIRYLRHNSVDEFFADIEDDSLDFIHLGVSMDDEGSNAVLMSKCWPKLRYGGTLAGGFGNPSALNPQMRTAVLAFAEVEHRQPLLGLNPSTQGLWLLRK